MERKRLYLMIILVALWGTALMAEDKPGFSFGLDLDLGTQSFMETVGGVPQSVTYQKLALKPDFALGKFGIGFEFPLYFNFSGGSSHNQFQIREEDWVPPEATIGAVAELYLPKFRYIRYGFKGEPLYIKLGSIENATLGNGFIMGNYSNTLFLPETRIFGMSLDVDGKLFNFPYVGMESFVGNLAHLDVIGSRLYMRPLYGLDIPILKELQLGGTVAADVDPDYHSTSFTSAEPVLIYGSDLRLPILNNNAVSLATFGSLVFEPQSMGGMVGFGGRLVKIISYGAQIRVLGKNFVPVYFDASYDLFREQKYDIVKGKTAVPGFLGWFATAGFALFEDLFVFNVGLDGPFAPPNSDPDNILNYPHLSAVIMLNEGVLPGFFFDASYEKNLIREFTDIFNPEDAVIGARVHYRTGPAVISLIYNLKYNPDATSSSDRWEVTSGLQSTISLF